MLVAGEAGIGKTVLLRAALARIPKPLLWGMCDSLSTPRPLGALRDIAADLDPSVATQLSGPAVQHEIFAAVLDALRARPHVLVMEDLHWADEATLDLVRFLARRIATLPLLMVLSYRDAIGVDHPLSPVLGDLVAAPDALRLQLAPLSAPAVAALLDGHALDGHALDPVEIHRRTAGNPFFVSQILAQPDSPLPRSVRDAVIARVAALDPPPRRHLELLSCTPEPVSGALLAALGVPSTTVERLAATGLIDRSGDGVAFRHEIARSAVLGATTPGSEPALHASMIRALEEVGGDASLLAHHATAAGDVARILRYSAEAAAEAARSGAHREAVAFYDVALRHAADDPEVRATLLEDPGDGALPHRPSRRRDRRPQARPGAARRARRHRRGRRGSSGHLVFRLVRRRPRVGRPGRRRRPRDPRRRRRRTRSWICPGQPLLPRGAGGRPAEALQSGATAQKIADEIGDEALHATAVFGMAVAELSAGT